MIKGTPLRVQDVMSSLFLDNLLDSEFMSLSYATFTICKSLDYNQACTANCPHFSMKIVAD